MVYTLLSSSSGSLKLFSYLKGQVVKNPAVMLYFIVKPVF